jgi:hypothetical protein
MDDLERRVSRLEQQMAELSAVLLPLDGLARQVANLRADMERGFSRLLGRPWTVESALESLERPSPAREAVTIRIGIPLAPSFQTAATGLPADRPSIGERDGESTS